MWFIIITFIINLLIIYRMKKNLNKQEIYITWGMLAGIAVFSDLFFGQLLDLYDFLKPNPEPADLLVELLLPSSFGIIFLNFLPVKRNISYIYIIAWTICSCFYEWLSVFFHYERIQKGWSPFYSIPIYFLVFIYLRWHIRFIRKGYFQSIS